MNIFLSILILVVGFVLLIKGADLFVDGASSTAQNFRVSKMLIGLTIVAFGTSAPELAVSIKALATGSGDMVLGNVIGSNILNILLILGITAIIRPIKIKNDTVRKEIPLCLLVSLLLIILFLDTTIGIGSNQITRADGVTILLFFTVFLYYLINMAIKNRATTTKDAASALIEQPKFTLGKSLLLTAIGIAGIIIGSELVVNSATDIATTMGVSERIISLTIIAFGTSLPELVTSVVSAIKGESDLAIGNIIGSNIFNICVVLGVPSIIFGNVIPTDFAYIDLIMLGVSALLLFVFSATKHRISRAEGLAMFLAFAGYYTYIFLQ